jgi:hypothetical protein
MLLDIPLPWDTLHLATIRNLSGYAPGFVEFESPIVDPVGQSVFILTQSELGKIGTLTLRKLGQTLTEVGVEDASSPEDRQAWPEYVEKEKRDVEQILEDLQTLRQKKDNLAGRRHEHLQDVMQAYFNRLLHDLTVWTANKTMPPPYLIARAGLVEWPDKSNMSQEGREYFEKYKLHIGQEAALAQVGAAKPKKEGKVYLRHRSIWKEIGFYYRSSEFITAKQGIEYMRKKHPKFKMDPKTLDNIIKAGLSGDFD